MGSMPMAVLPRRFNIDRYIILITSFLCTFNSNATKAYKINYEQIYSLNIAGTVGFAFSAISHVFM